MTRNARLPLGMAAIILALMVAHARAQIGVQGSGPAGPGQQQTNIGPEDPEAKAERTRRLAETAMRKAIEHREQGRIQAAVTSFKSAFAYAVTPGPDGGTPVANSIAVDAVQQLRQIQEEGLRKLEAARKLLDEGRYVAALAETRKIRVMYAGVLSRTPGGDAAPNVADLATELMRDIEGDPKAIPVLQEAKAAPLIKKLARLDRETKRDPGKRLDIYNVLATLSKRYPESEAGRRARARLAEIRRDASLMAWIEAETQARQIRGELTLADQFVRGNEQARADEIYAKLKARYPGNTLDEIRAMAQPIQPRADLTAQRRDD